MSNPKRDLVIVRAGDSSLHKEWLGVSDSWDLIVSYFGSDPSAFSNRGRRIDASGPKWPCIGELLRADKDALASYEYVFFPDDDLLMQPGDIERFFSECRNYELKLAQPSLTLESYAAHGVTLHNSGTRVRFVNYVELMAPCFRLDALLSCMPTFGTNISGWGLDILWPHLINSLRGRIGVVDGVQITHTRPFGGPNYVHNARSGLTPAQELLAVLKDRDIKRTCIAIDAVVSAAGRELSFQQALDQGIVSRVAPWLI